MASKNTTVKKGVKKKETIKPVEVLEEKPVEEDISIPKRYYAQFWKKVQPMDSRFDELAGTIYWSDVKQKIIVEGLNNRYSSDVEAYLGQSLNLPHNVPISYVNTPKEWIRNLHLAELGHNFYATQYMEIVDETE